MSETPSFRGTTVPLERRYALRAGVIREGVRFLKELHHNTINISIGGSMLEGIGINASYFSCANENAPFSITLPRELDKKKVQIITAAVTSLVILAGLKSISRNDEEGRKRLSALTGREDRVKAITYEDTSNTMELPEVDEYIATLENGGFESEKASSVFNLATVKEGTLALGSLFLHATVALASGFILVAKTLFTIAAAVVKLVCNLISTFISVTFTVGTKGGWVGWLIAAFVVLLTTASLAAYANRDEYCAPIKKSVVCGHKLFYCERLHDVAPIIHQSNRSDPKIQMSRDMVVHATLNEIRGVAEIAIQDLDKVPVELLQSVDPITTSFPILAKAAGLEWNPFFAGLNALTCLSEHMYRYYTSEAYFKERTEIETEFLKLSVRLRKSLNRWRPYAYWHYRSYYDMEA